jgi:hypothetical protein
MSDSRRRSTRRVKHRTATYAVNDLVQVGLPSVLEKEWLSHLSE